MAPERKVFPITRARGVVGLVTRASIRVFRAMKPRNNNSIKRKDKFAPLTR